jgi:hypothetical protein
VKQGGNISRNLCQLRNRLENSYTCSKFVMLMDRHHDVDVVIAPADSAHAVTGYYPFLFVFQRLGVKTTT